MRRNTHTKHSLRIAIALALLTGMTLTAKAQIFLSDGEEGNRAPEDPSVFINLPDDYGLGVDWYTPTGSGIVLLSVLGGAYLLGKRGQGKKQ